MVALQEFLRDRQQLRCIHFKWYPNGMRGINQPLHVIVSPEELGFPVNFIRTYSFENTGAVMQGLPIYTGVGFTRLHPLAIEVDYGIIAEIHGRWFSESSS
jgi:hypothetical protein